MSEQNEENGNSENISVSDSSGGSIVQREDNYIRNESMLMDSRFYVENYHIGIKVGFAVVGGLSMVFSLLAITALQRTKRIPGNAKFLATALLVFDSLFITMSSIRKFVINPTYNTNLNVLTTSCMQLTYLTVGMMALERFCVFYRPMMYMRIVTRRRVKTIATCAWIIMLTTFQIVRYGVCYVKFKSDNVFMKAGLCNQIVTIYYTGLVLIVLLTSMLCYFSIFMIVKKKHNATSKPISFNSTLAAIRGFKTTSLVLVYILVIFSTSLAYSIIIIYIRLKDLGVTTLRMSLEVTTLLNCICDPFLYVLWFRECRMEILKMFAPFNKRLQKRIDAMKMDIFNIVISTSYQYNSCNSINITEQNSESLP